ncbi:MAG: hypothetical protein DWQ02_23575 [Bacteroidetes bacterium]|nr:MAG: hypothetical protein DWQ02_23575 [Bacteroidota bacterium]
MLIPAILLIAVFFLLRKKQLIPARVFLIIGFTLAFSVLGLLLLELSDVLTDSHYQEIGNTITHNLEFPTDENQQRYQLIGLSHAATGMAQYAQKNTEQRGECTRNISEIVSFVLNEDHYPVVSNRRLWKDNIFEIIYINNILAQYEIVKGTDTLSALHQRMNDYLAGTLVKSRYKNLQSFDGDVNYWTADNTYLIFGLQSTDRITGQNTAGRPTKDWSSFIFKQITYPDSKLPCSAFSDTDKCKEMPHGTHLATMIASLADVDPESSRQIWREYRHHYKNGVFGLFATFDQYHPEETPPAYQNSIRHPLDAISPEMPTLIAAARINDRLTYFQITNQLWLNEVFGSAPAPQPKGYEWKNFLELSLRFEAETVF